jgi:hypothetical protein
MVGTLDITVNAQIEKIVIKGRKVIWIVDCYSQEIFRSVLGL